MEPFRSSLFVPATRSSWVENAPFEYEAADAFCFDLEDATPPEQKQKGRDVVRNALGTFDDVDALLTVRINPRSSGWLEDDLAAIIHPRLDAVKVPKLASPDDVRYVDNILSFLEQQRGIADPIEIMALPETAAGFYNAYGICDASERVTSISAPTTAKGDVPRSLGYEWTERGLETLYMRSKVIMEARAAGLTEIRSGLWTDIDDIEGLRGQAEFAKQLGFTGYEVIHPSHVDPINEIFTPVRDDVEYYRKIVERLEAEGYDRGTAAIRYDGELVDTAVVETARRVIERARHFGVVE